MICCVVVYAACVHKVESIRASAEKKMGKSRSSASSRKGGGGGGGNKGKGMLRRRSLRNRTGKTGAESASVSVSVSDAMGGMHSSRDRSLSSKNRGPSLKKRGVEALLAEGALALGSGGAASAADATFSSMASRLERHDVYRHSTLCACLESAMDDAGIVSEGDREAVLEHFDISMNDALQAVPCANRMTSMWGRVTSFSRANDTWWFAVKDAKIAFSEDFCHVDALTIKCEPDKRRADTVVRLVKQQPGETNRAESAANKEEGEEEVEECPLVVTL